MDLTFVGVEIVEEEFVDVHHLNYWLLCRPGSEELVSFSMVELWCVGKIQARKKGFSMSNVSNRSASTTQQTQRAIIPAKNEEKSSVKRRSWWSNTFKKTGLD